MAGNSERIDDVIDPVALKQVDDLSKAVTALEQQFIDTAKAANDLNAATGNSRSFRDYNTNATAAATQTARLQQAQSNAARSAILLQSAQQRLETQITRTQAAQDRTTAATQRAASPYQQLSRELDRQRQAAKDLAVQYGTTSPQFLNAAAGVQQLDGRLRNIDQTLGQSQRNVGNYGSALEGIGKKAFGAIRTIANILPGLGLSGAFLLIFEALKFIVEQFGLFNSVITVAELKVKSFKEALKDGGVYTEAVKNVSELRENIELAKDGFLDKDKVVKQFNDSIGKTIGQVSNLNEAEASLNKNASAFIKFTFLKATANAALELSAKKATEAQLAAVQDAFEGASNGEKAQIVFQVINPLNVSGLPSADALVKGAQKAEELKKKRIASSKDESDKLLKIFDDFQKQATALSKANKFDFFQGTEDAKAGKDNKQLLNDQLKEQKEIEDAVLNNTNSTYEQRIAAIEKFEVESYEIINKGELTKVLTELEASNLIKKTENDALKDRNKTNKDFYDEQSKIINDALKRDAQTQKDILKNSLDVADQYGNQQKKNIQDNSDDALQSLAEQYSKGLISTDQYQKQKTDIEKQAGIDADQAEINRLEFVKAIRISLGEDISQTEDDLAKAKRKRDKDSTDYEISEAERAAKRKKDLHDKEKELADDAFTLVQTLVDAGFQNQLNGIQEQKNALDDQTKSEIDAENRSLDSTATKADKIAIINAKAAAQQAQLDEKARAVKQKQAQADRLFAIAKIIENTAIGITSALAQFPPNIPLAFVIGAIGAVQLATTLATPIPKYEKGTKNAKGGISLVGEVGKEYVIEPSGKSYMTPDNPTLMNIPKGSKVISNMELMTMLANPNKQSYFGRSDSNAKMIEAMNNNTNKTIRVLRGNRPKRPIVLIDTLKNNRYNDHRNNHFR